jgi:hypothetical protein
VVPVNNELEEWLTKDQAIIEVHPDLSLQQLGEQQLLQQIQNDESVIRDTMPVLTFESRQSVELRIEVDDDYVSPIIRRRPMQLELNESVYSAFKEGDETKSELSFCEYDNGLASDL